jgi:hypothetical protein
VQLLHAACSNRNVSIVFPTTQSALIKLARGSQSMTEFAQVLGVHRSSVSRYESEAIGAPPRVINHCLSAIAARGDVRVGRAEIVGALASAREVVGLLEKAADQRHDDM